MIKTAKTCAVLLPLFGLAACSNFPTALQHGGNPFMQPYNYKKAQSIEGDTTTFKGALIQEYNALATKEGQTWSDWFDSDFFARKALRVENSDSAGLGPEDPANWRFSMEERKQFEPYRTDLVAALAEGHSAFPVLSAKAQASFDCWVEEQEEGWQTDLIAGCKDQFLKAYGELSDALNNKSPDLAQQYTVFFDFDSAALTPVSQQVLQAFTEDWGNKSASFELIGHTDTVGSVSYNQRLSERRAQSVSQFVLGKGVESSQITTRGVGENNLAVDTADGVREPQNRRVVVEVRAK